jgi:hypothetical protein
MGQFVLCYRILYCVNGTYHLPTQYTIPYYYYLFFYNPFDLHSHPIDDGGTEKILE